MYYFETWLKLKNTFFFSFLLIVVEYVEVLQQQLNIMVQFLVSPAGKGFLVSPAGKGFPNFRSIFFFKVSFSCNENQNKNFRSFLQIFDFKIRQLIIVHFQ